MLIALKTSLMNVSEIIHRRIFGHEMGADMRKFLGHLSWSFSGGFISAGIAFAVNIMAGRILGPEEYGKYGLVIAISSIFIIPMALGIETAATHYISKSKDPKAKNTYLNSALWIVLPLIFGIAWILSTFNARLAVLFATNAIIVKTAVLFSIFLALKNILDSFVKGFHFFKFQAISKLVEAGLLFVLFIAFLNFFSMRNFYAYLWAIIGGYLTYILILAFKFRKNFSFAIVRKKELIFYGSYAILGSISGILLNSLDKILVNQYLGSGELGIYNAYYTASIIIVSQLSVVFINVFFPFLSSIDEKTKILAKINRLARILFFPVFMGLSAVTALVVFLFGAQYGFNLLLIVEFGFLATLTAYFTSLWWLIASKSLKGIQFTSFNGIIAGLIFVGLTWVFRDLLTLHLVVIFLICAVSYAIIIGNVKYARIK